MKHLVIVILLLIIIYLLLSKRTEGYTSSNYVDPDYYKLRPYSDDVYDIERLHRFPYTYKLYPYAQKFDRYPYDYEYGSFM